MTYRYGRRMANFTLDILSVAAELASMVPGVDSVHLFGSRRSPGKVRSDLDLLVVGAQNQSSLVEFRHRDRQYQPLDLWLAAGTHAISAVNGSKIKISEAEAVKIWPTPSRDLGADIRIQTFRADVSYEMTMIPPALTDSKPVFVSHAGSDRAFADLFVDQILRIGCGLTDNDFFYSSDPSTGVPGGTEWFGGILEELRQKPAAIVLVTEGFWESPMCLLEAGAALINADALIVRQKQRVGRDVLGAVQGYDADKEPSLLQLIDDICARVGKPRSAARASKATSGLIAAQNDQLPLATPGVTSPSRGTAAAVSTARVETFIHRSREYSIDFLAFRERFSVAAQGLREGIDGTSVLQLGADFYTASSRPFYEAYRGDPLDDQAIAALYQRIEDELKGDFNRAGDDRNERMRSLGNAFNEFSDQLHELVRGY